jgi:hypothetical protein
MPTPTTTTQMMTAVWFHDAADDDYDEQQQQQQQQHTASYPCIDCGNACRDDYCDECLFFVLLRQLENREAYEEDMKNHKYGVCIDCGVGLDYETEFLVDRRETQCDSFICDMCFDDFHGDDALYDAVHWQELGKTIPQFVRINCLV